MHCFTGAIFTVSTMYSGINYYWDMTTAKKNTCSFNFDTTHQLILKLNMVSTI